jgi:hypothetical protein
MVEGATRKEQLLGKIPQIEQGKRVRPPKEWWNAMLKIVSADPKYKRFGKKRRQKITAGIWHDYTDEAKENIIREIASGKGGIPHNPNNPHKKTEIRCVI